MATHHHGARHHPTAHHTHHHAHRAAHHHTAHKHAHHATHHTTHHAHTKLTQNPSVGVFDRAGHRVNKNRILGG